MVILKPNFIVVLEYFKNWKLVYATRIRYEMSIQYAASTIFDILETKLNMYQSRFIVSLTKFNSQKILVEHVK